MLMNSPPIDSSQNLIECPSEELLVKYFHGQIDEAEGSRIDVHLESCESCNETLSDLEKSDANFTSDGNEDEIIRQAIAFGKDVAQAEDLLQRSFSSVPEMVGPYRLIKPIGRGGMGCVYQAEHQRLHKAIALKLLPLGIANAHAIERFEREIQAAGRLHHPSIVNATDAGTEAGYLYLAMELIDGTDLGRLSRSLAPLAIADVCELGRQLALGLAHAHQNGMVHRDIKPSNVMLNSAGQVKLLDFGLVMLNRWDSPLGELTTVGQFLGTLDYMAPEQAERSSNADYRSDLYSLGATMFRLLTGQLPVAIFPDQSPLEKLRVLSNHSPLKIATLRSDAPEGLAKLIDQLLKTNPSSRPASAAHVAEALEEYCSGADLAKLAKRAAQLPVESEVEQLHTVYEANVARRKLVGESSDSDNRWWITIACALVPFLFYLGWMFVIEDSKGNLVIQSDLDDAKIQVKKVDGTKAESISIQQGNSLTRLRAGSYEVELDTPSDGFVLSPKVVELKRGETVIAKIQRANQNAVVNKAKDESHEWLPEGVISEDLLQATYKDKSILEHLRQVHLERDHPTWLASVSILEKAIPDEDKPKIAPFIQASAERKGFLNGLDCLKLITWIPYEDIDQRIATWLISNEDHVIKFLGECTYRLQGEMLVESRIEWTRLKRTWQEIEDWLQADSSLQRRLRVEFARRTAGGGYSQIHEVRLGTSLNVFLYENYPRTGLAIAEYYQYQATSFGLQTGTDLLPSDSKDTRTRIEARLELARQAILNKDSQELFWTMKSADGRAADLEKEYWQLVSEFVATRLENWAESNELLLPQMVQIQLSFHGQSSWSISSNSAKKTYGYGGMGGGMGQVYTQGLPPGASARVSESIELLETYQRLPEALRPREALEKVRAMHEAKDRELTDGLKNVFGGEWSSLSWTDDMRLQRYTENGSLELLDPVDQNRAIAIVLHRWVVGLLDTDFLEPAAVVHNFFREVTSDQSSQATSQWIHSALRPKYSAENFKTKLAVIGRLEFEISSVNSALDTAVILGAFRKEQGNMGQIRVRLELESEGWRIRSVEWLSDGQIYDFFN